MKISASLVKELRERSGAGMMDCKKSLVETEGNIEDAMIYLREKGIAKAAKKAGRIAAEGLVSSQVDDKGGIMLELNCETDFAAKGESFMKLTDEMLTYFSAHVPEDSTVVDMTDTFYDTTVEEMAKTAIAKIGENIKPRRFVRFTAQADSSVHSYIHMGGKIGVLIEVAADSKEKSQDEKVKKMANGIAMQIASMNPDCVDIDTFPKEKLAAEKSIYVTQVLEMGKPEKMVERIVEGKIKKFVAANTLLEQDFVMNSDMKVKDFVKSVAKEIDTELKVVRFIRFELGEGIEKEETDFAAEVAAQMNS
ncbi:elongation factor Ts [bacterium]|nr:elongation factor Ts [bacterium]